MTTAAPLARYGTMSKARVASGSATTQLHHLLGHDRTIGPPGGTFVLPSSVADTLVSNANNVAELEQSLALEPGTLGSNPVRIDVPSPSGLRFPSGNELVD